MPTEEIVQLKPSTWRWIGFIALAVVCTVLGIADLGRKNFFAGGLLTVAGLMAGSVSVSVLFSKKMILVLNPEGFRYGSLRRQYFYRWSDVHLFGVGHLLGKKTCFTLNGDYRGDEKVRATNRATIGFDRFFPDNYGKKPWELAELLEDWRHRYSTSSNS